MNFFNYKVNNTLGDVWSLFTAMGRDNVPCNHSLEIITAKLNGNIKDGDFNLVGYDKACTFNKNRVKSSKSKKYLSIVDTEFTEGVVGYGDVSEAEVSMLVDNDCFSEIEDKDSAIRALSYIKSVRGKYIEKLGVDILVLLRSSVVGMPMAYDLLKTLTDKNSELKEAVENIVNYDITLISIE